MTILGAVSSEAFRKSSQSMDTLAKNLANDHTPGRFADSISWQETSVAGKSSGVETKTFIDVNSPLTFTGTANEGDITIMGDGMLVITTEDGSENNLYIKTGSFEVNKNGDLEDSGKYLKGYAYDDNGVLSTAKLVQIKIDKDTISEAEATTKIDLAFKLNADTVATGDSGILLREVQSPEVTLLRDKGIIINRTTKSTLESAPPTTEQFVLQYGGFVETRSIQIPGDTAAAIDTSKVAMTFSIKNGSQPVQNRELKVDIPASTDNAAALDILATEINQNYGQVLGAKVLKNDTIASLFIYSQDNNSQITIALSADLENVFGGKANFNLDTGNIITSVDATQKRFATIEQLQNILSRNSFNASFIGAASAKDKMFLYSTVDEMIEIRNQDPVIDILGTLGVPKFNQGNLEPIYSYLDSNHNMAGGQVRADYQERVSFFDSKGGKKDVNFSFKKISTTAWVAEVSAKGEIDATSKLYRDDGLLQAGILNFTPDGQYLNSTPVTANLITRNYFNDPSADLGATPNTAVQIGGQTFTYVAAPANAGKFNSLIGLMDAINKEANCSCIAALAPIRNGFALVLKPKAAGNPIPVTGDPSLLSTIGLRENPEIISTQNTNIPLFGSDLIVDWAINNTQVAPTHAQININGKTSKELKGQKNLLTYQTNGSPLGEYDSWYIDKGNLYMKFKNGAKGRMLYAIPVAVFQAPQYFQRENGAYAETGDTGAPSIRLSGAYAGTVESKALADSGSNGTDQLVSIVDMNQFGQMNATAMSIANKLIDEFLRKI
ncbi:MAG: hypothetical protein MRQ07_03445 [Candidatus Midichloria sp.]|nr:hypothetical protein [Candidatus Midichloria sp.]